MDRRLSTSLSEENIKEAIRLYVYEKLSLTRTAEKLDCSVTTISRVLKKAGVDVRPRGRPKLVKEEPVVEVPEVQEEEVVEEEAPAVRTFNV